jgi:Concanavalin A-like lectin/glucanases superfamily
MPSRTEINHDELSGRTTFWSVLRARYRWAAAGVLVIALGALVVAAVGGGSRAHASTSISCQPKSVTPPASVTDAYDRQALSLDPVMYLTLGNPGSGAQQDLSGNGHNGVYLPAGSNPAVTTLPNGDPAASFNGVNQYLQVPSSSALSVPETGCLSVQAWIKPGTLQFSHEEGTGYVYVLGKGTSAGTYEYAMRMYSKTNTESPVRPNRISAYAWNLSGGLGSGGYFQDPVTVNQWIMVTFVIDANSSSAWPSGYVSIYKDGALRDQVSLSQYDTKPGAGDAPFRAGSRDLEAYFQGAIGKVAVYDYVLSGANISAAYGAM